MIFDNHTRVENDPRSELENGLAVYASPRVADREA
jgi:hypothetical protein